MKYPDSIQVQNEKWRLQFVSPGTLADHEGLTDHESRIITVASGRDPGTEAGIVLHELLHALWGILGLPEDQEERVVNLLGVGLAKLMQDNPELFRVLLDRNLGIEEVDSYFVDHLPHVQV